MSSAVYLGSVGNLQLLGPVISWGKDTVFSTGLFCLSDMAAGG